MIITNKINVDLARIGAIPCVDATQDDKYSRKLEIKLYENGTPWFPPENVIVFCKYEKPDGTGGEYSTMPDNTTAWSVDGNSVTVLIAPQVLTVAGNVSFSVTLASGRYEISTFSIGINVNPIPGFNVSSEDYVNMRDWLISAFTQTLDENGETWVFELEDGTTETKQVIVR